MPVRTARVAMQIAIRVPPARADQRSAKAAFAPARAAETALSQALTTGNGKPGPTKSPRPGIFPK
jgi:hypothetical protein